MTPGKPGRSFCRSSITSVLIRNRMREKFCEYSYSKVLYPKTDETGNCSTFILLYIFYFPPKFPKASRSLMCGFWLSATWLFGTGECYSLLTTHVKPTALSQEEILAPVPFRSEESGGEEQVSGGHRPPTKAMAARGSN